MSLILTPLPSIHLVQEGDDLRGLVMDGMARAGLAFQEGDILIVAQKVVSKAEGRMVNLSDVLPSAEAHELGGYVDKDPRLVELILRESSGVLRKRPGALIVEHRLGFVCANAGIDHSNVAGEGDWVLLLPENPDRSAEELRQRLGEAAGVGLGVLIIDSHGRAWRQGTVGVAVGLAGMPGLVDLRGRPDLFGYSLRITQVGAADELAAGASLMMGQANEGTPFVHARGFPYPLREATLAELIRPKEQDMFR
jgi:coenzyme F420-0:L-glutamate ligase / coenzyme F420-1:gamma-L-glutamate ligase